MTEWISVKDRLPEGLLVPTSVIVCVEFPTGGRLVAPTHYFRGSFAGQVQSEVTHWMPFPEPPTEGENESP